MSKRMLAAFLDGPLAVALRETDAPDLRDDRILVRVRSVGVCGSDVHYYQHGRMGPFVPTEPLVLGHECAGEVVAVGSRVRGFAPGDRVALEPGIPCGRCEPCKRGRYNLCPSVYFMGSAPDQHGAFRELLSWDPGFAYRLPDAVSFEEGALLEPLAAAVYAARLGGVTASSRVAVFGSGPIGLLITQVARAMGAVQAIVCDVDANRLTRAGDFGATTTVLADTADPVTAIRDATGGEGVDIAFEAAGSPRSHRHCLEAAARGGTVVFVGWLPDGELALDLHAIGTKELTVRGMFRYRNVFPEALALVANGAARPRRLVSGRYPLTRIVEALEAARARKPGLLKIMIDV